MPVLLLRLCGPMQSWGTQSRFTNRDTELEPSKSGVMGLICAAMGTQRDDLSAIEKLAVLKMGVRVDREGVVKKDFHTAGGWHLRKDTEYGVPTASGKDKKTVTSDRFYLSDACFLVGLLGDGGLLEKVQAKLKEPVWQIYLGRKSFVPGLPVWLKDGLKADKTELKEALRDYPYLCEDKPWDDKDRRLRLGLEVPYGQGDRVKQDQPVSFESDNRRFGLRHVITDFVDRESLPRPEKEELCTFLA